MSQIITHKEGHYAQIKLTSGEGIMLSCAEGGVTIFKTRFFGVVPAFKCKRINLFYPPTLPSPSRGEG